MQARRLSSVLAGVVGCSAVVFTAAWISVHRTLPKTPTELRGLGVSAKAEIAFDRHGVPTLRGATLLDLLRLQGYVLARDRFFQMDLIRRRSAGRLAEILGPKLVPSDRQRRTYGFQRVADRAVAMMTPERKAVLEAYAAGVNAFLREGPLPPEIAILGYRPYPWKASDCALVVLGMFDPPPVADETNVSAAMSHVPKELVDFLGTDWGFLDAPMFPEKAGSTLVSVPPPGRFDLRGGASPTTPSKAAPLKAPASTRGSNAWALAGSRTKSGVPLLAGDPHLELNVPNIWYRLRLEGAGYAVTGVTLGGIPGVILGSNGYLSWTMTNPFSDQVDRVIVPRTARREKRTEVIAVKGEADVSFAVEDTEWGPVMEDGLALEWVALDPEPLSRMDVLEMNRAHDLASALEAFSHWTGPAHNVIFATKDGHIGWTLVGCLPRRVGFDGSVSVERGSAYRWAGYHPFSAHPKIVDPPSGVLVNANQRPVPVDGNLHTFGRNWPSSNRARLLTNILGARNDWTVDALRDVQLDLQTLTHVWYRDRLLEFVGGATGDDARWLEAIRAVIEKWDGRIVVDSSAYPIVREFRTALQAALLGPMIAAMQPPLPDAARDLWYRDTTVKALIEQKPAHLLSKEYADYGAAIRASALRAAKSLVSDPAELASLRWGPRNRASIRHPFSQILPRFLGELVDMPADEQAGDIITVRSATPNHGASMRMLVDLADPSVSRFAQPGGQSGHFLSSNYRDQHATWAKGEYGSFEPESAVTRMAIVD